MIHTCIFLVSNILLYICILSISLIKLIKLSMNNITEVLLPSCLSLTLTLLKTPKRALKSLLTNKNINLYITSTFYLAKLRNKLTFQPSLFRVLKEEKKFKGYSTTLQNDYSVCQYKSTICNQSPKKKKYKPYLHN